MERLSNVKETSSKTSVQHTHEDLAKKLQEELERNASRKAAHNSQSSSSSSMSSSTNTNSSATSVLNCTKCGSISLVPSNSTQCPSCGFKVSEEHGRGQESGAGSFGSSPQFSSHFWSNSPAPQGSGPRMQEVACPTCTVHLQVQLPSSGTETVECGVCQHPFLVNAN
jgi:ribosomal protein L37E